jgi:hypothetical protein
VPAPDRHGGRSRHRGRELLDRDPTIGVDRAFGHAVVVDPPVGRGVARGRAARDGCPSGVDRFRDGRPSGVDRFREGVDRH